jgi:hypothetical protein
MSKLRWSDTPHTSTQHDNLWRDLGLAIVGYGAIAIVAGLTLWLISVIF